MNRINNLKWYLIATGIIVLLLLIFIVTPYFTGQSIESRFKQNITAINKRAGYKMLVIQSYQRHWFSSNIKIVFKHPVHDMTSQQDDLQPIIQAHMHLKAYHGPISFTGQSQLKHHIHVGLGSFVGEGQVDIPNYEHITITGLDKPIHVAGILRLSQRFSFQIHVPPLDIKDQKSDGVLHTGDVSINLTSRLLANNQVDDNKTQNTQWHIKVGKSYLKFDSSILKPKDPERIAISSLKLNNNFHGKVDHDWQNNFTAHLHDVSMELKDSPDVHIQKTNMSSNLKADDGEVSAQLDIAMAPIKSDYGKTDSIQFSLDWKDLKQKPLRAFDELVGKSIDQKGSSNRSDSFETHMQGVWLLHKSLLGSHGQININSKLPSLGAIKINAKIDMPDSMSDKRETQAAILSDTFKQTEVHSQLSLPKTLLEKDKTRQNKLTRSLHHFAKAGHRNKWLKKQSGRLVANLKVEDEQATINGQSLEEIIFNSMGLGRHRSSHSSLKAYGDHHHGSHHHGYHHHGYHHHGYHHHGYHHHDYHHHGYHHHGYHHHGHHHHGYHHHGHHHHGHHHHGHHHHGYHHHGYHHRHSHHYCSSHQCVSPRHGRAYRYYLRHHYNHAYRIPHHHGYYARPYPAHNTYRLYKPSSAHGVKHQHYNIYRYNPYSKHFYYVGWR